MEYRKFGRTGVEVSSLCLGTMLFGGTTDKDEAARIVARSLEAGINFFDTANVYGRGTSETVLGEILGQHDRDEIFLATKAHGRMKEGDHQPNRYGNSRRMIIEECHHSLRRLQTDYIDLYQIHRPQNAVPIDETLRALDDLVRQGKVRYLGCSTFAAWQVVESLWVAKELGLNRFVSEQPPYHLLDRRIERELVPMAQTFGMAIIPWAPLASGFLTGKFHRDKPAPEDSRIGRQANRQSLLHENSAAHDVVDLLREMATRKDCSISQIALAWCRTQPGITAPIIGPRTLEQVEDNLGALSIELSDEDGQRLDEVAAPGRAIAPYYQAEFGPSLHRSLL